MPQETAESAAQMRRVIVDQIEALAELNRIVARHGRALDDRRAAARRAGARARRDRAPRRMAAKSRRCPTAARDTGAAARIVRGPTSPASAPAACPRRRPRRSAAAQRAAANAGGGRSGWLSDLLHARLARGARAAAASGTSRVASRRAARRRDAQRADRNSIESLDSLSVDIARMIDHDAAAELWDRYNRGERNVFTRKLYTMQGQQAFEEIRAQYRADREFKQTVDRYIAEFERLLEEVSRDDRGQVVARTYLTSETGKVYTMLAHAAGRFD